MKKTNQATYYDKYGNPIEAKFQVGPQYQNKMPQSEYDYVNEALHDPRNAASYYQAPFNPNQTQQFPVHPPVHPNVVQPQFNHTMQYSYPVNQPARVLNQNDIYMMQTPFTYPDNQIVELDSHDVLPKAAPVVNYEPEYGHIAMPLNPLPHSEHQGYFNEIQKTGYIPAPRPYNQPNPFYQADYLTQNFQTPQSYDVSAQQPSQIQIKLNQLETLLANKAISYDNYLKRKNALIQSELNFGK